MCLMPRDAWESQRRKRVGERAIREGRAERSGKKPKPGRMKKRRKKRRKKPGAPARPYRVRGGKWDGALVADIPTVSLVSLVASRHRERPLVEACVAELGTRHDVDRKLLGRMRERFGLAGQQKPVAKRKHRTQSLGDRNRQMPFGKYRGVRMHDIPDSYIEWLHANVPLKSWLKAVIEKRVGRPQEHGRDGTEVDAEFKAIVGSV